MTAPNPIVLRGVGLRKSYGAVTAVDGVDIDLRAGQILAVVGDNGAGKTSLMKMLAGALRPDGGQVLVGETDARIDGAGDARDAGVEMVYQDLALAPNLDVTANFMLGREFLRRGPLGRLGVLDRARMREVTVSELQRLDIDIPRVTGRPIGRYSGGQRQAVAVARSICWASKVLLLDEPTAALGVAESQAVLRLMRSAADEGIAVMVISHILPHVVSMADHVVVLRHGRKVAELDPGQLSEDRLVRLIVGIEAGETADPVLTVPALP